jgi:uncharacterized damage-inducible protein DinB
MAAGMTAPERPEPPLTGDERTLLVGFLDWHRATLAWKCARLSTEQLAARPIPSTSLSLLGLVRHLADVERGWMGWVLGARGEPLYGPGDADFDGAVADPGVVRGAFADWQAAGEHTRSLLAPRSLDDTFDHRGETWSIRALLVHLIEEYARHNGHADLLREAIDGETGE